MTMLMIRNMKLFIVIVVTTTRKLESQS